MKAKVLFSTLVAAAMLAACNNADLGENNLPEETLMGGYATFTINLPTVSGTGSRATSFEDGTKNEYAVNDATLLIFKQAGGSEGAYTYVESAGMGNMNPWNDDASSDITTSATIVAQLTSIDIQSSDEYYALVLLNKGDILLPTTSQAYSAWNNTVLESATGVTMMTKDGYFYMANAPEWRSSKADPTTLIKIDKSKIKPTVAEAQTAGTAADIYVERGMAKVTISAASVDEITVGGTAYNGDKVTITNWALDVANKKSYAVHNFEGLSTTYGEIWENASGSAPATNRFVGGSSFNRIYWGKDPNYSTDLSTDAAIAENFIVIGNSQVTATQASALYCLENTFDIAHQVQGQTTRVVFKATYVPNGFSAGDNFYKIGNQSAIWSEANLIAQIRAKAIDALALTTAEEQAKVTIDLGTIATTAGVQTLTTAAVKYAGTAVTDAQITTINDLLGCTTTGISTYLSGESYYIARIKHFGDSETPWKAGDPTYNGDNLKYLGRYGVLRNNWYELNVNAVSNPGSPDVPELKPTNPDDENEYYLQVTVKILAWAKRTQNVEL